MNFAELFEESMKALAQGNGKRMKELSKAQEEKITEIRKQKKAKG